MTETAKGGATQGELAFSEISEEAIVESLRLFVQAYDKKQRDPPRQATNDSTIDRS
ncbi:MAG: hypothetical protein H6822_31225 [Planctomycetaceae bacterium]|nr:hypothetical protein [Planctomycetales bacterium]MCB9926653.1 hypothetical protein [Planctomycetaceae bacterium]